MDKKITKWWQKLILIVASPLVFLLLAEFIIRVGGINTDLARNKNFDIAVPIWLLSDSNWVSNEYDRLKAPRGVKAKDVVWLANFEEARYIQFKLKPQIDVQATNPFNDAEVRKRVTFRITSNKDGFRTHEFAPKKKGTLRIVTLGDSSTFGWGLDGEDTWQNQLEKRLIPILGQTVDVMNLGISGHSSRHGLGVLHHYAWGLAPDLLIVSFGANDARFVLHPADALLAVDDSRLGAAKWTLTKLRTFQLLRKFIFSLYDPFKKVVPRDGELKQALSPTVPLDKYRENLKTMIAEARTKGAAVVLLGVCSPDSYLGAMQEVAESQDVPFVDARKLFLEKLPALKEGRLYPDEVNYHLRINGESAMARNGWLYVTSDGCHPNRAGAKIIADALTLAAEKALALSSRH